MTGKPAVNQTKGSWEQQMIILGNFLIGPPLNSPSLCLPAHLHPPFLLLFETTFIMYLKLSSDCCGAHTGLAHGPLTGTSGVLGLGACGTTPGCETWIGND